MNTRRWLLTLMLYLVWITAIGCQRIEATPRSGPPPRELFTEELLEYQVVSVDGAVIGPVDGIVVALDDAEAVYVVVRIVDIYDFGKGGSGPQERFFLIPWPHVTPDTAHHQLMADVSAAVLAEAPTVFDLPDTATPEWDAEAQHFWAQQ
jgi:sporulation protein YlmC with PRC-barrel domain